MFDRYFKPLKYSFSKMIHFGAKIQIHNQMNLRTKKSQIRTVCKKLKVSLPLLPFINWWFVQVGSTSSQKMEAFWVVRESTEEKVKSYFCIWQDRIIFFSVATFHLQDNKYPKSNFSRTFFLLLHYFCFLLPSNYQWHFATTRN